MRGTYLAFNSVIAEDARRKKPRNIQDASLDLLLNGEVSLACSYEGRYSISRLRIDCLVEVAIVDQEEAIILDTLVKPGIQIPFCCMGRHADYVAAGQAGFEWPATGPHRALADMRACRAFWCWLDVAIPERERRRAEQAVSVLGHLARETLTADEILAGVPISASYASQLAVARRVGAFELTVSRGWHKEGRIVVNTEFAEAMARTLSRSRIVLPRSLGRD